MCPFVTNRTDLVADNSTNDPDISDTDDRLAKNTVQSGCSRQNTEIILLIPNQ